MSLKEDSKRDRRAARKAFFEEGRSAKEWIRPTRAYDHKRAWQQLDDDPCTSCPFEYTCRGCEYNYTEEDVEHG